MLNLIGIISKGIYLRCTDFWTLKRSVCMIILRICWTHSYNKFCPYCTSKGIRSPNISHEIHTQILRNYFYM